MSFVKSKILKQLSDNFPTFLRRDLSKCLDLVFDEIIKSLANGKHVEIRGFGSLKIKKYGSVDSGRSLPFAELPKTLEKKADKKKN